ncbi:MAG: hypothetical protein N2167_09450 [Flavobacteriales bacterium]|nr:hypothetical protein [Flavobacteriales bacterium]
MAKKSTSATKNKVAINEGLHKNQVNKARDKINIAPVMRSGRDVASRKLLFPDFLSRSISKLSLSQ